MRNHQNNQRILKVTLFVVFLFTLGCTLDARFSNLNSSALTNEKNPSTITDPGTPTPIVNKRSGVPIFNEEVKAIRYDSKGRALYSGYFSAFTFEEENFSPRFIRLNDDGSIDTSFNVGLGFDASVSKIALTPTNEIMTAGGYYTYDSAPSIGLMRILSTGAKDTTFPHGIEAPVYDFDFNASGQLIAVGDFYYWDTIGNTQNAIVRINPNGSRDTSLVHGTSFSPARTAYHIKVQTDGKMIVAGNFNSYNGASSPKIIRLNVNGSYDNTFVTGTGFNGQVGGIELLADGSVIVIGDFTSYNGTTGLNGIAKLNSAGAVDAAFKTATGTGFTGPLYEVKYIAGVGILIGGGFTQFKGVPAGGIVCLTTAGALCPAVNFGTGCENGAGESLITGFAKLNANTLIITGLFKRFNNVAKSNLVVVNLDGSISNTFEKYKGVDSQINSVLVQPDGKVLLGGSFVVVDPIPAERLARFNADQTLDDDFQSKVSSLIATGSISKFFIDSADRIWLSGFMPASGGYTANHLVRLLDDGTIDTACTNNFGTGFDSITSEFTPLPDGRMFITGSFGSFNGNTISRVARLNTNCTFDSTFSTGTGVVGGISKSFVLSSGKVLHVGQGLSSYSGTTVSKIIRVNSNGTLDGTYPNNSSKTGSLTTYFVDGSDRLYISGSTGTFNGTAIGRLARISSSGTVDTTFVTGTNFNTTPVVVKVIGNKVYVGGDFTSYNSVAKNYFIVLNEDGSIDNTVQFPTPAMPVSDFTIAPDGKIEYGYKVPAVSY